MPLVCCVPGCQTRSKTCADSISFHAIPVYPPLRTRWMHALRINASDQAQALKHINQYSVVCSQHFTFNSFRKDSIKRRLTKQAVPSIFPRYPESLDKLIPAPKITRKNKKSSTAQAEPATEDVSDSAVVFIPACSSTANPEPVIHHSVAIQVSTLLSGNLQNLKEQNSKVRLKHKKLKEILKASKKQIVECEEKIELMPEFNIIESLKTKKGDHRAVFLLDQIQNFAKVQPYWSESTLKHCLEWREFDVASYEYARKQQLMSLPSRSTLHISGKKLKPDKKIQNHPNTVQKFLIKKISDSSVVIEGGIDNNYYPKNKVKIPFYDVHKMPESVHSHAVVIDSIVEETDSPLSLDANSQDGIE